MFTIKNAISSEKNIKLGIIISYSTLIVSILISIIYTPFLLSHVGQSQYGLTSFVTSITSWFTVLTSALVSSYIRFATRENALHQKDGVNAVNSAYFLIFAIISLITFIAGVVLFVLMKYLILPISIYSDNAESSNLILILTVLSLLSIIISVFGNIFGLYNNWKQKFIITKGIILFVNILQPLCTIPFLIFGCDIVTIVIIQLIFTIIGIVLNLICAIKLYGFEFKHPFKAFEKNLLKEILIFSSFIILNSVVDQINNSADKTILGFMVDDNAKSVAIYQVGALFKNYLLILSVSISSAFSTKINEAVIANDISRVNSIFRKVSKVQMLLILFIVGGFAVFGQSFIKLWLGDEYKMSYYVTLVLFVISSVPLTENTSIEVQRAMNKHKFRAILYICVAALNIGLTIALVAIMDKQYAIWCCLSGTALASFLGHWITINVYNYKTIKLDIKGYLFDFAKITCGVFVCGFLTKGILWMTGVTDDVISLFASLILYLSFYLIYVLLFERTFVSDFLKKGAIENL